MKNQYNFMNDTAAIFSACEKPERMPDYISKSGSRYWYTPDGVIRYADHWGMAASCFWILENSIKGTWCSGFCSWGDFDDITNYCTIHENIRGFVSEMPNTSSDHLFVFGCAIVKSKLTPDSRIARYPKDNLHGYFRLIHNTEKYLKFAI